MAIEQDASVLNDLCKDDESLVKWKSVSDEITEADNIMSTGFDCNICLDFVQDPVVTLCGHLYCWPCIYKWIHFHSISSEYSEHQQQQTHCPVCKKEISSATLVPLYGRGQTTKPSNGKAPQLGLIVPRRPPGPCRDILSPPVQHRNYHNQPSPYDLNSSGEDYSTSPTLLNLGVSTTASTFHPIIGMFSEMVYTHMFGNSVQNVYNYPNSYHFGGSSSPRMRRHEIQADQSLSRICFFLFCCIFCCLVLF